MTLYSTNIDAACAMMDNSSMSITDLALITGIKRSQIYRWQSGEVTHMHHKSFIALSDALGYTFKYVDSLLDVTKKTTTARDTNDSQQLIDAMQKTIDLQGREIDRLREELDN